VPILAEAAALDARLNPFSKHDPEPLRIFSNSTGLQNFLCRIAADYLRENSSFRAVLTEQRSSLTPEAVLTGEADLGLIGGIRELSPAYRTKLELVQFVEDRHVVILPRDSSAAQQFKNRPILFAELLNLRFAALTDASPMTAAMKERALAAGFRFEPIIEAPSFSLLVELVARGPLAAVVPASAVPPNAPVEVRELEDSWAARPLAFVLPKARPALPSAIDFVEFALRTQKR
jgi:DNA-binding transcriptional LysR family regulator